MGIRIEKSEEEMVETVDFSKGNITQEQIKCRYPDCEKDGVIPMFETDIIDLKKVIPYCHEHALVISKERERKKLREEILQMREEGLL